LPVAGVVPYDDAVVAADERGTALIEHEPAAPSVASIRRLADDLLGGSRERD
jgi:Flp pilus assembly CpaE family ATPase